MVKLYYRNININLITVSIDENAFEVNVALLTFDFE